jgi:hypothetical protein
LSASDSVFGLGVAASIAALSFSLNSFFLTGFVSVVAVPRLVTVWVAALRFCSISGVIAAACAEATATLAGRCVRARAAR